MTYQSSYRCGEMEGWVVDARWLNEPSGCAIGRGRVNEARTDGWTKKQISTADLADRDRHHPHCRGGHTTHDRTFGMRGSRLLLRWVQCRPGAIISQPDATHRCRATAAIRSFSAHQPIRSDGEAPSTSFSHVCPTCQAQLSCCLSAPAGSVSAATLTCRMLQPRRSQPCPSQRQPASATAPNAWAGVA